MQNLLNVNQVAFILKVHPLTIRRYIKEKKLVAVRVGGSIRISESEINNFTKTFEPKNIDEKKAVKDKAAMPIKIFDQNDPFLRLEGRGAGIRLNG
jgi:excisionase family DNA binding protein